ncbi:MAG: hypothetical protein K8U03_19665 [Planctomycetia bacterium]|nr:hypothetical protein [Planctomycetia bacterium]
MSIETELPAGNVDTQTKAPTKAPFVEPVLIPVLDARWALTLRHVAITAAFCGLFVFLNHMPLRGTDLWGHLVWGQEIIAERAVPTRDGMQPLSDGMRVVDMSWLSQVIYASVLNLGGPEALVGLFTAVVFATYLLIARICFLLTRNAGLSTALTAAALGVGWNRISTIRPENFAIFLFVTLLWLLVERRMRRDDSIRADDTRGDWKVWLGIPVLFALWANLHGSFAIGVALLGCDWLGRLIEVAWHERSLRATFADREGRRLLYWTELAAIAVLVNPYTIDAWIEALRFSSNANLRDVLEWNPLQLLGVGGIEFALSCVAAVCVLRHSRRSLSPADVLMLGLFGLAALLQVRMTGWFAVVWVVTLAPHFADVLARIVTRREAAAENTAAENTGATVAHAEHDLDEVAPLPAGRSYRYTLACAGLIWIAFAFSTFSRPLLGGTPRTPQALFGEQMPLNLTTWLVKNPPQGQVFNPQYWGDWIGWAGPKPIALFADTNMHLTPPTVWRDYRRIFESQNGWENALDRYDVKTLIVDRVAQPGAVRALRTSADWILTYEDPQAMVYRRKSTRPTAPTTEPTPAAVTTPTAAAATSPVAIVPVPVAAPSATKPKAE